MGEDDSREEREMHRRTDDEGQFEEPWYGLSIPSGLSPSDEPTILASKDYSPEPAKVPPEERRFDELEGDTLKEYLETIVGFSYESRRSGNRLWGRIPGRPSLTKTINWVADQFREAGIPDVEVQQFDAINPIWRPQDWEVRLVGKSSFGNGSEDVILESAIPTPGSTLSSESITAPIAYVGDPRTTKINQIDVDGKVVVQRIRTEQGVFPAKDAFREGSQYYVEQGAVAVLNIVGLSGNMQVYFGGTSTGTNPYPSFNLGNEDGTFLERVMTNAAQTDSFDDLEIQLALEYEMQENLTAENAVGIIPGKKDENIIINAHADGWFAGADDNASGVAVLLGLARHFAKLSSKPERTLVFVASSGHNTPQLDGPENFVQMNPDIVENNSLVINIEHTARMSIEPIHIPGMARDEHQLSVTGTVEDPKVFGISNNSSSLESLVREGIDRYGISVISEASNNLLGDIVGYEPTGSPMAQMAAVDQLYHTTGDVPETVSTPGMERAARFWAFFVKQVSEKRG